MEPASLRNQLPRLRAFAGRVAGQAARFPDSFFLAATQPGAGVALTFDDGPNPASTDKLLAILADLEAPATFFVLGKSAKRFPTILRRIAAAGHAIGSHGYRHDDFTELDAAQAYLTHIDKTGKVLTDIIGGAPHIYRPPYGKVTDQQIEYFAKRGFVAINWSVDSCDWLKGHNQTEQIVATVMDNVHDGAIILFHSNRLRKTTFAALPRIITELRQRGYVLRTVPDLLAFESQP